MEFFCYHRDRPGSTPLRSRMVEQHWSYMDRFAATMIARGPTFTSHGTLTGSVHILDLPDPTAARAFAFEEPGYQAGAYRDVLLRRWRNSLGRRMWDFNAGRPDYHRYLVLGFTLEAVADAVDPPIRDELIASGPLLSDDGSLVLGAAVLLEAPDADAARQVLSADRYTGIEVHQWRFGGRPN
ncbi:YciI family protein [Micromonospora sp. DT68]|uniref:YciI family protein n=1 Tax=Micromonospora TaxID=1873 RepID=UPI0033BF88F8